MGGGVFFLQLPSYVIHTSFMLTKMYGTKGDVSMQNVSETTSTSSVLLLLASERIGSDRI